MLDSAKANKYLNWEGRMDFYQTTDMTFEWYKKYNESKVLDTEKNISDFFKLI